MDQTVMSFALAFATELVYRKYPSLCLGSKDL